MDTPTYTTPAQETPGNFPLHETYAEKLVKRKKKLRMNLVEFSIWLVLLVFCFNYLKSHPAEKLSVFSSVEVLVQKAKVAVSQWTSGQWNELKVKYSLERSYKEMINIVEDANCLDPIQREEIKRMYSSLQQMEVDDFVQQEPLFVSFLKQTYSKVEEECNVEE